MRKKNFKKIDIVKILSTKIGFSKNYSKKIIEDIISFIILNIKEGEFNLKNIGTFKIIKKKERIGRNPKTKEEHIISARKSISFISSKKVNNFYE